jgi:hypothetical protein
MDLNKKLGRIQQNLKAHKSQYNDFGKYKYRNLEDICEAVKPLLNGEALTLIISDEMVMLGDRFYVKATAKIFDNDSSIIATAYARESLTKKGMDESQITGAASSYARKYCLNGLFLIDDTKDADSLDNTTPKPIQPTTKPAVKLMDREQSDRFAKLCEMEGLILGQTAKAYDIRYSKNKMTYDEFEEAYKILSDNVKTGDIEMSLVVG